MRFLLFLISITLLAACDNPPPAPQHWDVSIQGKIWMTMEREDCIAAKCPCECEDSTRADWIFIDSINGKWQAIMHRPHSTDTLNLEILPGNFIIGRNSNGEKAADFYPDEDGFLRVVYKNHNLVYTNYDLNKSIVSKENRRRHDAKNVLAYLNASDTLLRSLLTLDSTDLYCDSVLGNVIYAPELPQHKKWIVKMCGDSIELWQYNGDGRSVMKGDTVKIGMYPRH